MLPDLVGPVPAVQPFSHSLTLTSPGKTISLPVCVQSTYGARKYQTCTYTAFTGYQFTHWSCGALEPREINVRPWHKKNMNFPVYYNYTNILNKLLN